jgi:hypothetical protein
MATGRFVTAPNVAVAMPDRAAVAVIRSRRTSVQSLVTAQISCGTRSSLAYLLCKQHIQEHHHISACRQGHTRRYHQSAKGAMPTACQIILILTFFCSSSRMRADESKEVEERTYVDCNDVGHCSKRREPGPHFPEEGCSLDLLGLSICQCQLEAVHSDSSMRLNSKHLHGLSQRDGRVCQTARW